MVSKKLTRMIETGYFPELLSKTEATYYLFGDTRSQQLDELLKSGQIIKHNNKIIKSSIDRYLLCLIMGIKEAA